ncbi:MAG: hypothetical protein ACYDD1_05400 [Caulobacteraceae bacterium]
MRPEATFSFREPNYVPIFQARLNRLQKIRADPACLPALKAHYKANPADFIHDWGVTFDPRRAKEANVPSMMPFLLFPKQREWVEWIMERWEGNEDGITEKSRDMGISWLAVSLSVTLCLFHPGVTIGFGSQKEDLVDKSGDPDCLFWKARTFAQFLPKEFRGPWDMKRDAPHKRVTFPVNGSMMIGTSGDNIGRGGRASIFFVDEAAHLEHPQLVDAALSQNTNCRIDMSSVNGMGNPFAQKRFAGKTPVFTFHWRDDPRKNEEWYQKQLDRWGPVIVAQEIDIDYAASVEGVLIPSAWVQSSIDADKKLGITVSGAKRAALDIADQGIDTNALCVIRGPRVELVEEWSGKGSDTFKTVQRAFRLCDDQGVNDLRYDGDGIGALARGDARVINETRPTDKQIAVTMFRASGAVVNPEREDIKGRKNQDYFRDFKAQSWWSLRQRFEMTHLAVTNGNPYDPDGIVVLDGDMPNLTKLTMELSQPTFDENGVGKLFVDKAPDGTRSPNLADSVMMAFARMGRAPLRVSDDALEQAGRR